jgi:hypothetical protein
VPGSPEETHRGDRGRDKARIEEKGVPPLGPDAIRRQSPETIPPHSKKSPARLFLAASKRVRTDLRNAYYSFVAAFREAADQLKGGNRNALFRKEAFRRRCRYPTDFMIDEAGQDSGL